MSDFVQSKSRGKCITFVLHGHPDYLLCLQRRGPWVVVEAGKFNSVLAAVKKLEERTERTGGQVKHHKSVMVII